MTDERVKMLIDAAVNAAQNAYAPYSGYVVGAALQAADGTIFGGCNVENAAYSPTICAERTALVKAVSEGVRAFAAIAVVTRNGGAPCGVCRQVLYEFAPDLRVLIGNLDGHLVADYTLRELLPGGFGPDSLKA